MALDTNFQAERCSHPLSPPPHHYLPTSICYIVDIHTHTRNNTNNIKNTRCSCFTLFLWIVNIFFAFDLPKALSGEVFPTERRTTAQAGLGGSAFAHYIDVVECCWCLLMWPGIFGTHSWFGRSLGFAPLHTPGALCGQRCGCFQAPMHNIYIYLLYFLNRRKFRSQTSDKMDRWKAEQGRGREKRKIRREKIRRERDRKSQKKEDADARKGRKVAKHCVFPMICC